MARKERFIKASSGGLTILAYPGDDAVLLALDLDAKPEADFAGFAIKCIPPHSEPYYLYNRLNLTRPITAATTPNQRRFTPSNEAPFQKFRWIHVPKEVEVGDYTYEACAMYFRPNGSLGKGASVFLSFEMTPEKYTNFDMGFTRGYISSQAYVDKFKNAPIRPAGKKTLNYEVSTFQEQYKWLGFHARKLLLRFFDECLNDRSITVDLFAYDIDEPDIVHRLEKLGGRLRAFLDNASLHTKVGALEPQVLQRLIKSAGAERVKVGHFKRFAHNKVLIQKKNGLPIKVLTGSANFSVRGLYVQANNILVFDDPYVAGLYEEAFEQAFNDKTKTQRAFPSSNIASDYFEINVAGCPGGVVAFSPHKEASASLDRLAYEIKMADSSVMFAIMEIGGTGPVLDEIKRLDAGKIFAYGVTQSSKSLRFFKSGSSRAKVVPFAFLNEKVPGPFKKEYSGGQGQVVHHKFVAVDFNDSAPIVFTGSSNLAAGGEKSNGDNLIAIFDRGIATAYGVEAVRLLDHYDFRRKMKEATNAKPAILSSKDNKQRWWTPYYNKDHIKYHDRLLFSRPAKE
jgi:phosphatidylserine/phosphatidylglycerophosphate/cardiolipin synthase-like enzyme